MSRRQTLPPAAREMLAELAKRLREAPANAEQWGKEWATRIGESGRQYAYEHGTLLGIVDGAVSDIEGLLTAYAPAAKARQS